MRHRRPADDGRRAAPRRGADRARARSRRRPGATAAHGGGPVASPDAQPGGATARPGSEFLTPVPESLPFMGRRHPRHLLLALVTAALGVLLLEASCARDESGSAEERVTGRETRAGRGAGGPAVRRASRVARDASPIVPAVNERKAFDVTGGLSLVGRSIDAPQVDGRCADEDFDVVLLKEVAHSQVLLVVDGEEMVLLADTAEERKGLPLRLRWWHGRIVNTRGQPIPGATVAWTLPRPSGRSIVAMAVADDDGEFDVLGWSQVESPSRVEVSVRAAGYGDQVAVLLEAEPRTQVTLRGSGAVFGRCVGADGLPARGVRVVAAFREDEETTDEEGVFCVNGLVADVPTEIAFIAGDDLSCVIGSAVPTSGHPADLGNIALGSTATLHGRVVGAEGEGVDGASVRALVCIWHPGGQTAARLGRYVPVVGTTTDERGVFALEGLPVGRVVVRVKTRDGTKRDQELDLAARGQEDVEIALFGQSIRFRLSGLVVDTVADERVEIELRPDGKEVGSISSVLDLGALTSRVFRLDGAATADVKLWIRRGLERGGGSEPCYEERSVHLDACRQTVVDVGSAVAECLARLSAPAETEQR